MFAMIQLAEYMQAGVQYATWWAQGMTNVCSKYNYDYQGESAYNWWGCGSSFLAYTGPLPNAGEVAVGFEPGGVSPAARAFQVLSQSGFVAEGEHMLRTFSDTQSAPWLIAYGATHGSSDAVILVNRDRDYGHTVPIQLSGKAAGGEVQQWTYGRVQYDQSGVGNWSAAPVSSTLGPWYGSLQVTLPPWSVSVLVFGN
jgi:hypothetical protein